MPRRHLKRAREFNRDAQPFSCFDRGRYNVTIVRNIKGAEELDTPPALENDVSPEGKSDEEDYDRTDATTQVPIDGCELQVPPSLAMQTVRCFTRVGLRGRQIAMLKMYFVVD